MSVKAAARAWDFDVEPLDKLVALAIAEGATDDEEIHHADALHLSEMTGIPPEGIWLALERLTDGGALIRVDLLTFRFAA